MIDDAEKAKKLARAICSDIALYNGNVKEAPLGERAGLIAGPIQEGRELFTSRVSPALASIFDEAIASIITPLLGVEVKAQEVVARQLPSRGPSPSLAQPVAESGGSNKLVVVVVIALLAIAGAIFFLRGH